MKKITTSLLVAFLLTMVGALMIGGATVAWFTSEAENTGNSFASGTLEIDLDKPNGTHYFDIKNIAPGDKGSSPLTVSNSGSLDLRYSFDLTREGGLFDGKAPLVISIADSNGNEINPDGSRMLKPGANETFTVLWLMPFEADNSYQGQSGSLGIGVYAEQTTAP